jgi:CheY-like chemotaxis protein
VSLLDLFMAGQEGLETIRALRRVDPQVKIIAISAGGKGGRRRDYWALAVLSGARRTLRKPFLRQELLDAVREVIQGE